MIGLLALLTLLGLATRWSGLARVVATAAGVLGGIAIFVVAFVVLLRIVATLVLAMGVAAMAFILASSAAGVGIGFLVGTAAFVLVTGSLVPGMLRGWF